MKKMFLSMVFALVCIGFVMNDGAEAAKVLRLTTIFPADYFISQAYYRMAERIKADTNGEVEIQVYPANQLGSYENAFQEVIRGTIDMAGNYATTKFNKRFEFASFPGMIANFEEFRSLISKESPFSKMLKSIYEEVGVIYVGSFTEALLGCQIAKGKDIAEPFTTKNKARVVRTVPLSSCRSFYLEMGYQVATVPYAEIFSSLQTGIIDGDTGAGPETVYQMNREVIGSFIQYNNIATTIDFVINKKLWESFDGKTRDIITRAYEVEVDNVYKDAVEGHNKYVEELKGYGIKVIDPTPGQRDYMVKLCQEKIWPKFYNLIDKKVLDNILSYLGK